MKIIILKIFSLLILVCLLVGCSPLYISSSINQAEIINEKSQEKTIKYITVSKNGSPEDLPMVMQEANEQIKKIMPGVTVETEIWQLIEYPIRYETYMTAQEEIDVMWKSYQITNSSMVQDDVFTPLDEYVTDDIKAELPTWLLDCGRINGVQCYIPKYEMHHWVSALQTDAELFKKYFDVNGFASAVEEYKANPYGGWTQGLFDEVEKYMLNCKNAGEPCYFSPYVSAAHGFNDMLPGGFYMCCGPVISQTKSIDVKFDATVFNGIATKQVEEFFIKLAKWKELGLMRPDLEIMPNPREFDTTSASEPSLIWFHNYVNPEDPHAESYNVEEIHADGSTGWAEYPITNPYFSGDAGDGMFIPYTCTDPVTAMQFVDLMCTQKGKDIKNTIVYGVEGVHYTYEKGSNRLTFLDKEGNQSLFAQKTYIMENWANGNVHTCYLTSKLQPDNLYETYNQMMDGVLINPMADFEVDQTNITVEVENLMALSKEYMPRFYAGNYTPEAYDEYLQKMEDAGIQKVIKECQKQVDNFMEKK